jgi:hypothetical protein
MARMTVSKDLPAVDFVEQVQSWPGLKRGTITLIPRGVVWPCRREQGDNRFSSRWMMSAYLCWSVFGLQRLQRRPLRGNPPSTPDGPSCSHLTISAMSVLMAQSCHDAATS